MLKKSAGSILLSLVKNNDNNNRLKKMRVKINMESDASIKRGKKILRKIHDFINKRV